ncbi:MAG TPA: NAD(P)-dependent oxidoreductase [Aliidongia sp.]|nr:NAD(P)-dependent oxidoreductase [Aliidongia sp.]
MTDLELGFLGLGRMGNPMLVRLLEAGHSVHVYDPDEKAMAVAVQRGAKPARSPAEVASAADIVLVSLPTPDVVQKVVLGEKDGIVQGGRARIVIDLSTTGPRMAGAIAETLSAAGRITLVDSPVSGGVAGAEKGTLAMMVSCPKPVYEEVAPILKHLGKLFFVGEKPGLGQTLKLANNLLAAAALAVSSEAMVMGVKAGLDPQIMIDVINVSSGRNSAIQDKFPRAILPRTFDFGFATGLSYKDVRLCIDEAEALGVPMVVGSAVRQFLAMTNATFGPTSDFTRMVQLVEQWAGVEVDGRK